MTNSNSDKQLERMQYLMGYNTKPIKESKSNIEYHITAADGKTYGIIKENSMYYIKTTTPDKELVKESYEYINGYNYRNENGYKSYNEATKHLELKLMSINESCGKHEDVSVTLNPNKGKEDLQTLTEAARKELDRMHQVFENSNSIGIVKNIGNHGNPEGKGTATGADTTKNNAPFDEKTEATLDKDLKLDGTVEKATPDNKKVGEPKMDSDKAPKCQGKCAEKNKDVKSDLENEGGELASAKGKMNKGVVKEGCFDEEGIDPLDDLSIEDLDYEDGPIEGDLDSVSVEDDLDNISTEDDLNNIAGMPGSDIDDPEYQEQSPIDELDSLLEEFMGGDVDSDAEPQLSEEEKIVGPDKTMDGTQSGTDKKDAEWERIDEDETQETKQGNEETMNSYQAKGNLPVQSWDKMGKLDESIDRIVESICNKLAKPAKSECPVNKSACYAKGTEELPRKKETLKEAIDRIVAEEITKLDAFGKHPRYGKQPMTTPDNKEVLAGTAEKDWNDDSAKGSEQYGKKIGSSAPFDKVVDVLTDNVMKIVKESLSVKKK